MRTIVTLGLASLVVAAALGSPAAAKRKNAVATTLYLHGSQPLGELESYPLIADAYLPMTVEKPEGSSPKSKQLTNYVVGPNTQCAGNHLFPVWTGPVSGTITGKVKVTFHTVATPGSVDVRLWPDVASQLCTAPALGIDDYPAPAREERVELAAGAAAQKVVLKGGPFKAFSSLMLQITPVVESPFLGRVLYDSADMASSVRFKCIPTSGAVCSK